AALENGARLLRIDVIVHVEMSMLNEGVALHSTWGRTHYDVPSTRLILGKEALIKSPGQGFRQATGRYVATRAPAASMLPRADGRCPQPASHVQKSWGSQAAAGAFQPAAAVSLSPCALHASKWAFTSASARCSKCSAWPRRSQLCQGR